jgi:hypothetical protein
MKTLVAYPMTPSCCSVAEHLFRVHLEGIRSCCRRCYNLLVMTQLSPFDPTTFDLAQLLPLNPTALAVVLLSHSSPTTYANAVNKSMPLSLSTPIGQECRAYRLALGCVRASCIFDLTEIVRGEDFARWNSRGNVEVPRMG